MSLFIGNISRDVREDDLKDEFEKFGSCYIKFKVTIQFHMILFKGKYAFAEYKNERDAEDAMTGLNKKELGG